MGMAIGKGIMLIGIIEVKIKIDLLVEIDTMEIGTDPQVGPQGGIIEIIEIMIGMEIIEEIEVTPERGMIIKRTKEIVKEINTIPT